MKTPTRLLTLPLAALLAAGCIHTHDTVVKDETRMPVEFENDTAGRLFYETLSRIPDSGRTTEKHTEVSIPVVFSHEQKVVRGPNSNFNDAVRRCDTNQDRRITETEARIFSGTVSP
jgi:hypothetical protein